MWSALAMTCLGITIIVTGTAMCVAGWYLGHFDDDDDDEVRPKPERLSTPLNDTGRYLSCHIIFLHL